MNQSPQIEIPKKELILAIILALLPILLLVYHVEKYGVDVPYMDEWSMTSMFNLYYDGSLRIVDLAAPHWEHRPLFPRLIILFLGTHTGWNVKYELRLNVTLVILSFFLLCYLVWKSTPFRLRRGTVWLFPFVSLVLFSLNQHENWLWGWQISVFLTLFAIIGGFVSLHLSSNQKLYIIPAMLFGVIATYSYANGLLYWPLGLIILLGTHIKSIKRNFILLICFSSTGIVAITTYLSKISRNPESMMLGDLLRSPFYYLRYVASYLASPLGISIRVFTGIVIVSLLILIAFTRKSLRQNQSTNMAILPYPLFILWLFSIASGMLTSIGRGLLGMEQASTSRYLTFGNLFWICLLVGLYRIFQRCLDIRKETFGKRRFCWISFVLIAIIGTLMISENIESSGSFRRYHDQIEPARQALYEGEKGYLIKRLDIYLPLLLKHRKLIRRHHLSVFRDMDEHQNL